VRSAETEMVAESLLLELSGSGVPENVFALAVLLLTVLAVTPKRKVGNVWPGFRLPRLHSGVDTSGQGPLVVKGVVPPGRKIRAILATHRAAVCSVVTNRRFGRTRERRPWRTKTPEAVEGPLFVTVTNQLIWRPTMPVGVTIRISTLKSAPDGGGV